MINVTKTYLPPQEEYQKILSQAWEIGWITNRGLLVKELEFKLKKYLNVSKIIATTNGTLPLQIAIKSLELKGEIITTPFSYIATASSIIWENCIPVFVDIHPKYLSIDENKIEAAITSKTSGILTTHVFGNPCAVEEINTITKKYELKVIYDAAHCFGVIYKGKSIFDYGDISTCSFHATKLFHTGEGGAIFCNSDELYNKLFYSHNFGHNGSLDFHGLGINAKMSELQAALGLAILPYVDDIITERKNVISYYNSNLNLNELQIFQLRPGTTWNYSYYPVIFKNEEQLLKVENALLERHIIPRRYFKPSLNTISYIRGESMPISEDISSRIMCLPLYVGLTTEELNLIVSIINKNLC